jgi:hypothetical protein
MAWLFVNYKKAGMVRKVSFRLKRFFSTFTIPLWISGSGQCVRNPPTLPHPQGNDGYTGHQKDNDIFLPLLYLIGPRGRIQSEELIAIKCLWPNNPGFRGWDFPYFWMIYNLQHVGSAGYSGHQSLANKIAVFFIVIILSQGRLKSWQQCRLWWSYGS